MNIDNSTLNSSENFIQPQSNSNFTHKLKHFLPIVIGILVLIGIGCVLIYYILILKGESQLSSNIEGNNFSETRVSTQSITLSDYKEIGPTIIQQIYPKERAKVGGQAYNATQIIISAQLFIPVENDYSISSSFNHLGSLTTIDDIQGQSGESKFHLTSGIHSVEIQYINEGCFDTEYLEKTYGSEAKPLSIYFAIRKKSDKQTIKDYTIFDNPTEIKTMSKPYKYTDLYLHCQLN